MWTPSWFISQHNVNQIITQHTLATGSLPRSLWNGHYVIYIKVQFSILMWPCDPWFSFRVFSDCNFFGPFFRENTVLNATQCDWLVIVPPRTPSLTVFMEGILEWFVYTVLTVLQLVSHFLPYKICYFVLMLVCLLLAYVWLYSVGEHCAFVAL